MTDRFTDQLSDYLDGELNPLEQRRLAVHLETCAECRTVLADLRAIVAAAPHYQGRAPERDLWPGILADLATPTDRLTVLPSDRAALVGPTRSSRRFTWPVLLAASLLMAVLGGGAVWLVTRPAESRLAEPPSRPAAELTNAAYVEGQYEAAVADLERFLDANRGRLDSATVKVIDESLQKIDAAIAEAKAAIARDSGNGYLNRQVTANMKRKLALLRSIAGALART